MQSDFKPVHLQKANAKLDRHILSSERNDIKKIKMKALKYLYGKSF